MPSTNKTTNLQLSQFIGTDVPTFLGDYNGDMLKIDTAVKEVSDKADNAAGGIPELRAELQAAIEQLNTALSGFNVVQHDVEMHQNMTGGSTPLAYLHSTANKKFVQLSVYGYLPTSVSDAIDMVDGGGYSYLPILSCPDNCMNLSVGNVATGVNRFLVGSASIKFSATTMAQPGTPAYATVFLFAVWNGTRTVYYLRLGEPQLFLRAQQTFDAEITSLISGN